MYMYTIESNFKLLGMCYVLCAYVTLEIPLEGLSEYGASVYHLQSQWWVCCHQPQPDSPWMPQSWENTDDSPPANNTVAIEEYIAIVILTTVPLD